MSVWPILDISTLKENRIKCLRCYDKYYLETAEEAIQKLRRVTKCQSQRIFEGQWSQVSEHSPGHRRR